MPAPACFGAPLPRVPTNRRYRIANSAVADLIKRKAAVGNGAYYVVGEGLARAKRHERDRRTAKAEEEMVSKAWSRACTPTDCTVEALRDMLAGTDIKYVNPPGEAEFQLMAMLRDGHVQHGMLDSSDADAAIVGGDKGSLLLASEAVGRVGGRTLGGFAGPRIIAKEVALAGLWGSVQTGTKDKKVTHDLSHLTYLERTVLAACVGHDYDKVGTGKDAMGPGGAGIKGMALHKAVGKLEAAKAACSAYADNDLQHVQALLAHVLASHRSRSSVPLNDPDLVRLTLVCLGFYHHPILNVVTQKAEPYTPVQPATMVWLSRADKAVAKQLKELDAFDPSSKCVHIGCTGCGNTPAAATTYAQGNVQHTVATFPAASAATLMSTEAQPELWSSVVDSFLARATKLDPGKMKDEGLERAHESAKLLAETATITHSTGVFPPQALIRAKIKQSHDRTPYHPALTLILNSSKDKAVDVKESVCDDACQKRQKGTLCRHRAALLMFLWLNTCGGNAGNPGHRTNYWRVRSGPVMGEGANVVIRAGLIHTNRSNQLRTEELLAMEEARQEAATEDSGGEGEDQSGAAKKRRHAHPAEAWLARRGRIMGVLAGKVKVDADAAAKLKVLQDKHSVPRLTRKHMFAN